MKKWTVPALAVILIALTGCTATIYGVPQQRWDSMGSKERVAAMEAYRARQDALRQQREEWAREQEIQRERQRAIEAENARREALRRRRKEQARREEIEREHQREVAAEKARQDALRRQERERSIEAENIRRRRERVEVINRRKDRYGDLLRVTLEGGYLKLHRRHQSFRATSFRIAAGETKAVPIAGPRGGKATLLVEYDGRTLLLDKSPDTRRDRPLRLGYESAWERGKTYRGLHDHGPLELQGVTLRITILGAPPRGPHAGRRPETAVYRKRSAEAMKPRRTFRKKGTPAPREPERAAVQKPPVRSTPKAPLARPHRGNLPPSRVRITFSRGTIFVKGKPCPIRPQSLDLRRGEARSVVLRGRLGRVTLRIRYRGGTLAVFDRPGSGRSAASLTFGRRWHAGSTYRIRAGRSRRIEALEISVKAL